MGPELGARYTLSVWLRSDDEQTLGVVIRVKTAKGDAIEQTTTDSLLEPDWTS